MATFPLRRRKHLGASTIRSPTSELLPEKSSVNESNHPNCRSRSKPRQPTMPGRPSSRLRQGLDNEVYQAVTHLLQDSTNRPDVRSLYQAIQRSNSSLKRKPKRALEDSLERILDTLEDDAQEDEEAEADRLAIKEEEPNIMNKSITGSWKIAPATAPGTPAANGATTTEIKRREANGEPVKKRIKREKNDEIDRSPPTGIALEDLGGVNDVKRQLMNLLTLPLLRPQRYADLNVPLPRGILLHGPPGCGKSMLARASAAKLGVPFIEIAGPSVVSGMSGESEKQIRDRFDEARKHAPCLIFIDEIDVIAPKRESSQSQMEKRIVAQLLISMDSLALDNKENNGKPVIVLAATNRPDTIDSALRRGGRFDTEINMGVPNEPMREKILRTQTRNTPISDDVDFPRLAKMTPGFVGADLRDLVGKAATWAMDRYQDALIRQVEAIDEDMELDDNQEPNVDELWDRLVIRARNTEMEEPEGFEKTIIPMEAFLTVLPTITPSSKREGFATIPDTTWEDIGALTSVREELQTAIVEPIKSPDLYAAVGISAPTGVLLWGPPGCGKTLLAKAVAAESKANFISVKGPELLNKVRPLPTPESISILSQGTNYLWRRLCLVRAVDCSWICLLSVDLSLMRASFCLATGDLLAVFDWGFDLFTFTRYLISSADCYIYSTSENQSVQCVRSSTVLAPLHLASSSSMNLTRLCHAVMTRCQRLLHVSSTPCLQSWTACLTVLVSMLSQLPTGPTSLTRP